ncbi:GDP-L-fucose synthase family protein [Pelagibius litoralis]|uniref:GDP-L-fucose synthase family protein n=1 Tax=Pelagibius litoralis TaxID=374515 RepID=UPI0023F7CD3E|nr:GDP-L-fucose synthase [Pelagibius litoralis]
MIYDLKQKRVWVPGHRGMVGQAICRRLERENCILLSASRDELDLTRQADVEAWVQRERPQAIFLAAAKVGGIHANDSLPASFLYDNLAIELNIVEAARRANVEKLLLLGSSCIYPREAPQPMSEKALLTGPLEPTNQWYAIAKISGIMLCRAYRRQYGCDFISAMPTNVYGPGDNFHPEYSHVPAALLRRFHEAKEGGAVSVSVWGTGRPRREFLYVTDLADACVFLMKNYSAEQHINVGTGQEISVGDFAQTIGSIVGYKGEITFDTSRPDGALRKLLDVTALSALGWTAQTSLRDGLASYYDWFLNNHAELRRG